MIRITAFDDPRISSYRDVANPTALARAGLFVAEGRWVVERLLARQRHVVRSVLVTATAFAAVTRSVDANRLSGIPIYVVDQSVMDQIVGFNIHRGCVALAERPTTAVLNERSVQGMSLVLVLEGVNNPDNVGGIFRSAAAFGVDLVVLGPACGDPLYRKAIRTSMAATLDVPYVECGSWPGSLSTIRAAGLRLIALTPTPDAIDLNSMPRERRVALILGTEGAGLTPEALASADARVRIRTTDHVDSLNVTVAASIALHHFHSS